MENSKQDKFKVVVLGGCGFIGRHLVEYLISNNYVSKLVVIDKIPPQLAWLNNKHKDIFSNKLVEFKSANLVNTTSCQNAFKDTLEFDFAINLAAETRLGQSDQVYNEGIYKLSLNCVKEAAKNKIKKYIELSSGQMCSIDTPLTENETQLEPYTHLSKNKLKIERELANTNDIDIVILRPALVYGTGDRSSNGITSRILIGAIYKQLEETMKLLWSDDLMLNTVHVYDVCHAIWFVCINNATNGQIYNIVDKGNTTQAVISDIISDIFSIAHHYMGNLVSSLAIKTNGLETLTEQINDKHMPVWNELCVKYDITNTPLNPYLYSESLKNKQLFLSGVKLESIGFTYEFPRIIKQTVLEIINDYIEMKLFPPLDLN